MAGHRTQTKAREWLRHLLTTGLWLWCSAASFAQASTALSQPLVREQTIVLASPSQSSTPTAPDATITSALVNIASRCAVAFTGRVAKLERRGDILEVSFLVEEALVGAPAGIYIVREWAGLSPLGQSHYTLGQRIAVFLHAPGKAGLSSPVDGQEGIVPIVQESAEQSALLDLRRLATRVGRAMREPLIDAQTSAIALADAKALVSRSESQRSGPARFEPVRQRLPFPIATPAPLQLSVLHDNVVFDRPVAQ